MNKINLLMKFFIKNIIFIKKEKKNIYKIVKKN